MPLRKPTRNWRLRLAQATAALPAAGLVQAQAVASADPQAPAANRVAVIGH